MTASTSARLLKLSLGFLLILMGAAGTHWLWRSYLHAEETRRWLPVQALVISSQVLTDRATPHSPVTYRADIRYRYTVHGQTFTGSRIRRVDGPTGHKQKATAQVAARPAGKQVTCYVNPAQLDFAILEHSSRAALYSIWFPLLFVGGGAGMVWAVIREK